MQSVIKDSTETLIVYPPPEYDLDGVSTAATVKVATPAQSLPAAGDSMTIDAANANTNAAAVVGAVSLAFASDPTLTPGRTYVLHLTTGERVRVVATSTGTTVGLADPLPMAIPSGTPLKGLALTHALTAAETEIIGYALAKVTATIGGVNHVWDAAFQIVTSIGRMALDEPRLLALRPEVLRLRSSSDKTGGESLRSGWEEVLASLRARKMRPERINHFEALELPHASAVVYVLTRGAGLDLERVRETREEYERAMARALDAVGFWYDAGDADNVVANPSGGPGWNSITVVR